MKYILISGITLIAVLLISKLLIAFNPFNPTPYIVTENKTVHDELIETGKSTYLVYCSSCHGKDGKGNNKKAQDHTKRIAKKSVEEIINNGSNNFTSIYPSGMPAGLIDKKEAHVVSKYVAGGMKGDKPKAWTICANCHQENGEGIPFVAPNIKAYSDELIHTVLTDGKKGILGRMPSFKGRLSKYQIKAVATYIRSLKTDK